MSTSLSWETIRSHSLNGGAQGDAARKLTEVFGEIPVDLSYDRDYEKLSVMSVMTGGDDNLYEQLMVALSEHKFITVTIDGL